MQTQHRLLQEWLVRERSGEDRKFLSLDDHSRCTEYPHTRLRRFLLHADLERDLHPAHNADVEENYGYSRSLLSSREISDVH